MKQMKMKVMKWSSLFIMAVTLSSMMVSCNDDDTKVTIEDPNGDPAVTRPTDAGEYSGLATSDGILFNNGTEIGNGEQEFCFTGKQTIPAGTYTLKGWVYLRPGAELTIEAGTVIIGDKNTMASLIVAPGAQLYTEWTASCPTSII